MKNEKNITLKTLTKSSVWDLQENDVFRLWEAAEKDNDLKDNQRRYLDIIRSAFEIEPVKIDRTEVLDKLIDRGFKIGTFRIDDKNEKYAIKKRPIMRVTDLTYENIGHITATKLIEVLERNFGGGWDSLSQSIKDIIESGFDISTTTLPKDRLKKPGGLYEKKLADDYEVLVVPKGTWVEAIFAKEKPKQENPVPDEEMRDQENPCRAGEKPKSLTPQEFREKVSKLRASLGITTEKEGNMLARAITKMSEFMYQTNVPSKLPSDQLYAFSEAMMKLEWNADRTEIVEQVPF